MRKNQLRIIGVVAVVLVVVAVIFYACRDTTKKPEPGPGPGPGPAQCEFPLKEIQVEHLEIDKQKPDAKVRIDPNPKSLLHRLALAERTAIFQAVLEVVKAERVSETECKLQLQYVKKVRFIIPAKESVPGLFQIEVKALNGPYGSTIGLSLRSGNTTSDIQSQGDAIKALTDTSGMKAGAVLVQGVEVDNKALSLTSQIFGDLSAGNDPKAIEMLRLNEVKIVRNAAHNGQADRVIDIDFVANPIWVMVARQQNGQWLMTLAE